MRSKHMVSGGSKNEQGVRPPAHEDEAARLRATIEAQSVRAVAGEGASEKASESAKKRGGWVFSAALVILFLIGAAFALYPAYTNLYNEYCNARIASEYDQTIGQIDPQTLERELARAKEYNKHHTMNVLTDPFAGIVQGAQANGASGVADEETDAVDALGSDASVGAQADAAGDQVGFSQASDNETITADTDGAAEVAKAHEEYMSLLNITGDGVMGFIDVPKIDQRLAVYHGTDVEVLEKGIGHLSGTSLPVGGTGSHCVLSGHRGLPTAKLFSDLDQMEVGDRFYLHVLGEVFAYEVDDIRVVKPEQTSALAIQPGQDLVTLVTCTPYGVNTHRLLLQGHRVDYSPPEVTESVASWLANFSRGTLIFAAVMSAVILLAFVVFVRRILDRKERA